MALPENIKRRISRADEAQNYAAQHGMHGVTVRTSADGDSGTGKRYSAIVASEETVLDFHCALTDRYFAGVTIPAGFEIVGLLDQVEITSGTLFCYFAGY